MTRLTSAEFSDGQTTPPDGRLEVESGARKTPHELALEGLHFAIVHGGEIRDPHAYAKSRLGYRGSRQDFHRELNNARIRREDPTR